MGTEHLLSMPALPWISSNQRLHWSKRASLTRAWRGDAHLRARAAKLPRGLARVHIGAVLRFTDNRRRDPHNYMPSLKAAVDGLVDYGLIPDDSATYLEGPDVRLGPPISKGGYASPPPGLVEFTITDLSAVAS